MMEGVLLPGRLKITVPPVAGLPGAGDVAVTDLRATLGGNLTYYERVGRRIVAYHPRGIGLPAHCPHGGWRLGARLTFATGVVSRTGDTVACPRHR